MESNPLHFGPWICRETGNCNCNFFHFKRRIFIIMYQSSVPMVIGNISYISISKEHLCVLIVQFCTDSSDYMASNYSQPHTTMWWISVLIPSIDIICQTHPFVWASSTDRYWITMIGSRALIGNYIRICIWNLMINRCPNFDGGVSKIVVDVRVVYYIAMIV